MSGHARALEAVVLDVETTMRCPVGNNKASPFWPENFIVLDGRLNVEGMFGSSISTRGTPMAAGYLWIGHNIAFDIWHKLREGTLTPRTLAASRIWDTQLAEYLLCNQRETYPTLDFCAEKRGGTLKDDRVSKMFEAGVGAEDVPRDMLEDYLRADLQNTRTVFWSQYAEAMDRDMLPLLWSQMEARLATIEMIWNGLAVDVLFLERRAAELELDLIALEAKLKLAAEGIPGCEHLDPTKPQQLSTILFGGTRKAKRKVHIGKYKNGNDKFKVEEYDEFIPGLRLPYAEEWKGANGKVGTGDEVLAALSSSGVGILRPATASLIADVQDWRDKSKQHKTYFVGIRNLVMPDGKVHHNLNHCVAATGRLSSSDPNLQNITDISKSDIKEAFVSRWGDDGVIVEADYSQLEMVGLAVRSGCPGLTHDITHGVDMHTELFRSMHGRAPDKLERKRFKPASFALVYGAGAGGIAAQTGMSKADAKKFIDTFYARYPGVHDFHERMIKEVEEGRAYVGDKDKETGLPVGISVWRCPITKRCYEFREYPLRDDIARWKGKQVDFSPTEIKNYPVQGFATGDIVPLVIGKLYRVLRNNEFLKDKCLLINTVHDSVVFDVHKDVLVAALTLIRSTMQAAPHYIKQTWDYDFKMALNVGVSYGPNWGKQTEVELGEEWRVAA